MAEGFRVSHRWNGIQVEDWRKGEVNKFYDIQLSIPDAEELVAKLTEMIQERKAVEHDLSH